MKRSFDSSRHHIYLKADVYTGEGLQWSLDALLDTGAPWGCGRAHSITFCKSTRPYSEELLRRDPMAAGVLLRLAFVVYGGINRVDWRVVSTDSVTTSVDDVKRQLLPMLRQDIRPAPSDVARWTKDLIEETRALLGAVLPLADHELEFLERLNGLGDIVASLLTADADLQGRVAANPGLR